MKINYPLSNSILLIIAIVFNFNFGFSQNRNLEKAEEYLRQKGEVNFNFRINNPSELDQLTNQLSILNFDPSTNTVYVWANTEQFRRFQSRNIDFQINEEDNVVGERRMSNQVPLNQRRGPYPLTFPLTAYPTYADYALQMQEFATNHPAICELVDIGGTTEGVGGGDKRLLFVKLSDNVSTREQEPRVMYTSSMHGDEISGYPMMLELINYLITAYEDNGHSDHLRVKDLIDNSEIWINPSANPDGTYYNDPTNTSVASARRANDNGWDLNRNYPDNIGGIHPDGNSVYELETQHFMTLADNNHFVLSANFHGGTEVVNYPWDNTYTRHPDDDWFFFISKEYAVNCQNNSPSGYMDAQYTDYVWPGVTNGADWYRVEGGRQDYMNYYQNCKESTIELSDVKTIAASLLDDHWNYNQEALIEYLIQGTYGFQGLVKDAVTNNPINATITLVGHDDVNVNSNTITELPLGDYYRPTIAGTYDILFEADCYQSFTLSNQTISDYQTIVLADVLLTSIASSPPTGLTASNVGSTTATLSWDAISGATYDYQYRIVGSPTWTIVNTNNNSEILSGLAIATQYEAQVRSICNSSTSSFSSSINFTTTSTVTLHQGFFESGWDGWSDGGNDCARVSSSSSYEGNYSIRIRDNSGTSSAMTSSSFDLSSFGDVEISFYYYPNSMENGEDFWLRYYNGSSWTTIATYVSGTDFSNGSFYNATITLNEAQYNLASNAQFRFQNDASGNNDQIYIDQVIITGIPSGPDVTPPSTPSGLVTSNTTQTTTDLSWIASTDNIGVTGYDVYQDGGYLTNVSGTIYSVSGLTASTSYNFHVIAKDAAGNQSTASNTANITTLDPPDTEAPSSPTGLSASNTTYNSTDLSWTASTDNVGVTGYDVYQDGGFIVNVSGTTYAVTGLSPSTLYTYHIIARDAAGNSSASSNSVNVTTDVFVDTEAPTNPSGLSASNTTETSTDLSWTASTDNIGVTDYDVYQDGGFLINVSGTTYQVTGLTENTTYAFYVIANDAAGNSSGASNTVNETTMAAPTCTDGIQNGDETGVDCGGSVCETCSGGSTVLHQGYFETGWDGWTDGGSNASRYSGTRSYEGSYSIRLRDNSGTSSSMTLTSLDLSPYNQVEVNFYFYANSMENGEDFWLRYHDGSSWVTVGSYVSGTDFNNSTFNNVVLILDEAQYTLAANGQFRFQNDASNKNDHIYIDQVIITGINGAAARGSNSIQEISSGLNLDNDLALFPNPVKGNIVNVILTGATKIEYRIVNMLGQQVLSGQTVKEINVADLKAGIYFILVTDGEEIQTKKFIKQ